MTIKLNLGSGPTPGSNGWTNIDLKAGADLNHDLTNGLPFADGKVETIYTSHFLEHLTHQQICGLLKDCHRALRPGGKLSICVPNARRFINAYINEEMQSVTLANGEALKVPEFLLLPGEGVYTKAIVNTGSPIDWVNYIAYSNSEHNYLFDEDNLIAHMRLAGFENPQLRKFGHELDIRAGLHASIYAEATKSKSNDLIEPPRSTLIEF